MKRTRFKEFFQAAQAGDGMEEEKRDIQRTLAKLPPAHAALVRGFRWKFHPGNTLNGDDQHVGYMDDGQKEIAVAGSWRYSREFTVLHEIAHKVWEQLPPQLRQRWHQIVARTRQPDDQEPEEAFCHTYANSYVKNRIDIPTHPERERFIKELPQ